MNVTFNTVNTTPKNQNCKLKNNKAQKPAFGFVKVEVPTKISTSRPIRKLFDLLLQAFAFKRDIKKIKYENLPPNKDTFVRKFEGFTSNDEIGLKNIFNNYGLKAEIIPGEIK